MSEMEKKLVNNKTYMNAYNELKRIAETGTLNRSALKTMANRDMAWYTLANFYKGNKQQSTVQEEVANWFKKQGFVVKPEGVGWAIENPAMSTKPARANVNTTKLPSQAKLDRGAMRR